jgi:hypothetical protein
MAETHYTHPDQPISRAGHTQAVCGARVNVHWGETDDFHPTCERCKAWLAERNAPRIGEGGKLVQ